MSFLGWPLAMALLGVAGTALGEDWAPVSGHSIPPGAFRAGYEPGGQPIYVIRALHRDCWIPGKYTVQFKKGVIPFDGREVTVDSFEVYVGEGEWVRPNGKVVPGGAVLAGRDAEGRPLFVCRAPWKGGLHPGKVDDRGNAFLPHADKEVRVTEYEVLVSRNRPEYASRMRWGELHPPGTVFLEMSYQLVGMEGRLNLFDVDLVSGELSHVLKDSTAKGVKHSDLSNAGLAEFFNGLLSRTPPRLRVYRVLRNESQVHEYNRRYYAWGSYRWGKDERVTRVYPKGGVIDYRPRTAQFDFLARNPQETYLPDDLGSHFRLLTMADGSLPCVNLVQGRPACLRFVYQRPRFRPLAHPMAVKLQAFLSPKLVGQGPYHSAVEPALAVGEEGLYQVEFLVPPPPRSGEVPVYLSVGYLSDGRFRSVNEDEIVRELTVENQMGSFRLVLREDPQGTDLPALRRRLNENNFFLELGPGLQTVNGRKIWVVEAAAARGPVAPPPGTDGILVRARTREELFEANARLSLPENWGWVLDGASEAVAGHARAFVEAYSTVNTLAEAYLDTASRRVRDLARLAENQEVLMVLQAPDGRLIYKMDGLWASETRLPDGTRLVQKGTDSIPTGSKELAASRFARYSRDAGKIVGGLKLGMTLYQTGSDLVTAWRQGDMVSFTVTTVEGTVKVANQVVSLTKWATSGAGRALGYADAALGLFTVGKAVYDFRKASGSIDRMRGAEAIAGATLNTGMSILAVAYPPAGVIDPTFRATVTVLNRWIPGSKSSRDLTAAALADVGTAATFLASYLTTGINAETAKQGLTVGIEEIRARFPDRLFVPPK